MSTERQLLYFNIDFIGGQGSAGGSGRARHARTNSIIPFM